MHAIYTLSRQEYCVLYTNTYRKWRKRAQPLFSLSLFVAPHFPYSRTAQYSTQHTIHIIRRMNVSWLSIEMLYSSFVYVIKNILSPSEWSISLIRYRFLHYYEFCSAHFSLMCLFQFGLSFGEGRSNKFLERYVDL